MIVERLWESGEICTFCGALAEIAVCDPDGGNRRTLCKPCYHAERLSGRIPDPEAA